MRRRWILVPLLMALLALGVTAGVALAQGDGEDADSPVQSFVARVAAILGLDEALVQDALNQASREAREERLQMKLDRMVEQGRITQEQADEHLLWLQAKPDGMMNKFPFRGPGKHGRFGGRMFGDHSSHGYKFMHPAPEEGTGQGFFGSGLPADPPLAQ